MRKPTPRSVSFEAPVGPIEEHKYHDKDAEDVIQQAEKEKKLEEKNVGMTANDPLLLALEQRSEEQKQKQSERLQQTSTLPLEVQAQSSAASGSQPVATEADDPGLMVPVTPPREFVMVESPRGGATTRDTDHGDDDPALKRQRVEDAKKQRINQMKLEYESVSLQSRLSTRNTLQSMTMELNWM